MAKRKRTEQTDKEIEKEYNTLTNRHEELKGQIKQHREAILRMQSIIDECVDECQDIDDVLQSERIQKFLYRKRLRELEMHAEHASRVTTEKAAEAAAAAFHAEQTLRELAAHKAMAK